MEAICSSETSADSTDYTASYPRRLYSFSNGLKTLKNEKQKMLEKLDGETRMYTWPIGLYRNGNIGTTIPNNREYIKDVSKKVS
jgi:hypothetical protein